MHRLLAAVRNFLKSLCLENYSSDGNFQILFNELESNKAQKNGKLKKNVALCHRSKNGNLLPIFFSYPVFTSSKSTMKTLEQCVKSVQS